MKTLAFPESERYPGFSAGELVVKADYSGAELISFVNSLQLNFTFKDDAGAAFFLDVYIHMNKAVPPSLMILRGEDNKEIRISLSHINGLLTLERKE